MKVKVAFSIIASLIVFFVANTGLVYADCSSCVITVYSQHNGTVYYRDNSTVGYMSNNSSYYEYDGKRYFSDPPRQYDPDPNLRKPNQPKSVLDTYGYDGWKPYDPPGSTRVIEWAGPLVDGFEYGPTVAGDPDKQLFWGTSYNPVTGKNQTGWHFRSQASSGHILNRYRKPLLIHYYKKVEVEAKKPTITATVVSDTRIRVSIGNTNGNPSCTQYRVQRSTSSNFSSVTTIRNWSTSTSDILDQGLTPNTRYYYRVQARPCNGETTGWATTSEWTMPSDPIGNFLNIAQWKRSHNGTVTAIADRIYYYWTPNTTWEGYVSPSATLTTPSGVSGNNYYLYLRSYGTGSGYYNPSGTVRIGPFWLDNTPPEKPKITVDNGQVGIEQWIPEWVFPEGSNVSGWPVYVYAGTDVYFLVHFSGSVEEAWALVETGIIELERLSGYEVPRLSATFTLHDGYDAHSGVNKYQYRIGRQGSWVDYPNKATTVSTSDDSRLYARTVDNVGLVSDEVATDLRPLEGSVYRGVFKVPIDAPIGKTYDIEITAVDPDSNKHVLYEPLFVVVIGSLRDLINLYLIR